MIKKILLLIFVFLFIPIVFAVHLPLRTFDLTVINSNATSTSYQIIESLEVNATQDRNVTLIITLEAENFGASRETGEWLILIDDVQVAHGIRTISGNGIGRVMFQGIKKDITEGVHNLTLQHKRTGTSNMETRFANIFISANTLNESGNNLDYAFANATTTTSSTSFETILQVNYTLNQLSDVTIIYDTNIESSAKKLMQMIVDFNNINSTFAQRDILTADDIGSMSYIEHFENVSSGNYLSTIYGKHNTGSATDIWRDTTLYIFSINSSSSNKLAHIYINQESDIPVSTEWESLSSSLLEVHNGNNIKVYSSLETISSVIATGSFIISLNGTINSSVFQRTFGANDIGNVFITNLYENLTAGIYNISIFSKTSAGTLTIRRHAILGLDTELVLGEELEFDNPPVTTLISPSDNTITNITSQTFSCSATDDINLSNMTFYNNLTGSFIDNETKTLLGLSDSESFELEIAFNNTIIWNCESCDSSNNCDFADLNFTIIINQTFIPPVVMNLTLISPDNNTITSNNIINFEFSIDESANCSLFLNDISINTSLFLSGDNSFTENLTVDVYNWRIDCDSLQSETRRLIIIIAPTPPFQFCQNTIPETIIIIFLLILAFGFMVLPMITKLSELYLISGIVNIIVGIAYFFLLCLAMLNWFISLLFIGLGFFIMSIYLREVYDKKFG